MAPLKYSEIQQVVQAAFSALSRNGLEACLFGSVAMATYGMEHRVPKDVDVIVLNSTPGQTDEDIKSLIVLSDPNFFLVDSRAAGAKHRILWYSLGDPATPSKLLGNATEASKESVRRARKVPATSQQLPGPSSASSTPQKACKVDILIPGLLDIPSVPISELHLDFSSNFVSYLPSPPIVSAISGTGPTTRVSPIPSVPFITLLLLKLRAWSDHSLLTANAKLHERIPQDEEDIDELLRIGLNLGPQGVVRIGTGQNDGEESAKWMLGGFATWRDARRTVASYIRKWPRSATGWTAAGF
ncbi:hypothetical protein GALMADRAFT_246924 [Galerina marginata CBS 339.88]|uniref:Uncharacterized protein n=1 Tax=Galerina marginata (strain CBS 339.88) TaxID=685588 RepID=A0A067T089_GALM3|nr:hypothetical protein GALMADRAFT_246924 [Galerina marginata CBS 339.88]